ncbi:MAG: outer membrane beta-barrel protein [Muribaculaceae bacterium]|nr:outer membrane beta-barrel protein [Muribaculaceae bacterium]
MLRKLTILLLVAVFGIGTASAQKAEITASYGAYTQMDAMDMHDGWGGVNTAWGALNLGVNFRINNKIWVGPSYTFSSTTVKGGPEHSNIAYHVIMVNGRYQYYKNSLISMYAKLGIGVDISYMQPRHGDNYSKAYAAFQIVPVGVQFDINRQWAMFAEAGFGAQGLFQFGFKLKI